MSRWPISWSSPSARDLAGRGPTGTPAAGRRSSGPPAAGCAARSVDHAGRRATPMQRRLDARSARARRAGRGRPASPEAVRMRGRMARQPGAERQAATASAGRLARRRARSPGGAARGRTDRSRRSTAGSAPAARSVWSSPAQRLARHEDQVRGPVDRLEVVRARRSAPDTISTPVAPDSGASRACCPRRARDAHTSPTREPAGRPAISWTSSR